MATVGELADAATTALPEHKARCLRRLPSWQPQATVVTRAEIESMIRAVAAYKGIAEAPWPRITDAVIAKLPDAAQTEMQQWGTAEILREDVVWIAACVALELRR